MFDLEQRVAKWRQQMLAAGIDSRERLDELESHLREEIEQQTKSGMGEREAFNLAVLKIGQPSVLDAEFKKTSSLYGFLSRRRTLRITLSINGVLGLVWLICLLNIFAMPSAAFNGRSRLAVLIASTHISDGHSLLVFLIVSATLVGSALLVFDSKWGRSIIRTIALLLLSTWLIQDCLFEYVARQSHGIDFTLSHRSIHSLLAEQGLSFAFCLVSILILHLPEKANFRGTVNL